MTPANVSSYLADCRSSVLAEIDRHIPARPSESPFYGLMKDYPLRRAKALRPALCVATCRALGGTVESVLPTAAALELYHNAFLIHDDIEDGSLLRRDEPTLHVKHGVPIAVNVGDGMLALALAPLLENTRLLGLGKALRVLQLVARMARESAEGQALELGWVRDNRWDLRDEDYLRMVHKKTSYYSFIAPMLVGGIAAGAGERVLRRLFVLAARMGTAFQIQDDVLNLDGDVTAYGKEIGGDLWEGKHTLILIHMMRQVGPGEREEAAGLLGKERPRADAPEVVRRTALLVELCAKGEITGVARGEIGRVFGLSGGKAERSEGDVARLFELVRRAGSLEYARRVARRRAVAARRTLESMSGWMGRSTHREVLGALIDFITERDH